MKWLSLFGLQRNVKRGPRLTNIPGHVAFIMDGNGRWAQRRGMPRHAGHQAGVGAMRRVIEAGGELGISVLTFYAFSTENWSRPKEEVEFLMQLPVEYIKQDLETLVKKNVRLMITGRLEQLPAHTREAVDTAMQRTKDNTGLIVNLAVNYGGRAELTDATVAIAKQVQSGHLSPDDISEDLISQNLYAPELPEPDLIIRSSGEQRLSNFLLWQGAYAELYFSPKYWPDFNHEVLVDILEGFQSRERRFGGLKRQGR